MKREEMNMNAYTSVSYTHLDVYKRQVFTLSSIMWSIPVCIIPSTYSAQVCYFIVAIQALANIILITQRKFGCKTLVNADI